MRFAAVVYTEFLKLRRSKAIWVTLAVYTFMVGIAGFFMWLMKNPGLAESLGIFGKKAQFAFGASPSTGPPSWDSSRRWAESVD